ncbi:MBL fold metallo-hydrolase RNA specificity domain-containing protein [Nocardioides sp. T2.26MG-1]|uniref:MBL fold metallo-hydrolase RNA specificity domain-containing protein n=1 Tax=Nocardioides sp. T2.26MG-1 TaxID=3041166 RepID=UPI002477AE8D|nr:MBL fold metallo-hydrolase [Nocardioides sp. T2.26MG-1]CAI9407673.1 Ribonuclease [Nocardioides sp. T2.26MG-1]
MSSPVLTFLGAAGAVTGSKFLVDTDTSRTLVDAGLYQGLADLRRRNWTPFPVPAAELDAVVVSHAHLDHCGMLPRLVKEGFSGPVVCSPDTAELVEIVLRDSAHLQEEDARQANAGGYSKHHPALPLYDLADVERTLPLFAPTDYATAVDVAADVRVVLRPAGHILGSSTVLLETAGRRTLFSGDLGRGVHPILRAPADPPAAHAVVVESTYGDRTHPAPDPEILAAAVRRTIGRGGTVLVPAFAVDRTELVLLELHRLMEAGEVPRVPIYLDSPMALRALAVYRRALDSGSLQLRPDLDAVRAALDALRVTGVPDAAGSMRLNRPGEPCIIVSASGMATGGRVVHHLSHQLPDPRNSVVLTGYQAVGTRGRQLLDGAREVKMHGRYVPVRAEIVDVPFFSVHADAGEIVAWLGRAPEPPEVVYVVHGEPAGSEALARRIRDELGWRAVVPRLDERVRLD